MNLARLLSLAASCHPGRRAWGGLDYRQADERVTRLANALLGLGLGPGDRVALYAWNRPELLEALLGAWRAGLVAVPLDARLHPEELAARLRDSGAALLLHGDDLSAQVAAAGAEVRAIAFGPGYEELLSRGAQAPLPAEPAPEELAWIFFTSGTTGAAKGAMLTHRNLLTLVAANLSEVGASAQDVVLHALPLSHAGGFYMLHHLARGAEHVFLPTRRFDPEAFFATVARAGVSSVALAPTMISMLLPHAPPGGAPSLRTIFYGGAPFPREQQEEALARLGPIFVQSYGLGEAPLTVTVLGREDHAAGRLGSVGRPTPFTLLRLQDEEGRPVAPGEEGEIALRGDLVTRGYWRDPETTARVIRDGWFATGDVGRLDEAGLLYLTGRKKDLIKSGGATVSPDEVEAAILRHPAVQEVAVIGVPDPLWGEAVRALVVLRPGASAAEAEIIQACQARLASFKKPRAVEFVAALPRNANGKVLRRELRARYAPARPREEHP